MSEANENEDKRERITIVAEAFTPVAMDFHRRQMADKGYRVEGPIVRRQLFLTDGMSEPEPLLGGKTYYTITFVKS